VSESDFDRSFREGIQYGPPPRVIRERRYAFVVDESFEPRTTHFEMHSPEGLLDPDQRTYLPRAHVLLWEEATDGSVEVTRFARNMEFAGDSWDRTAEEALRQLDHEFDGALGPWRDIPSSETDVRRYLERRIESDG